MQNDSTTTDPRFVFAVWRNLTLDDLATKAKHGLSADEKRKLTRFGIAALVRDALQEERPDGLPYAVEVREGVFIGIDDLTEEDFHSVIQRRAAPLGIKISRQRRRMTAKGQAQ